MLSNFIELLNFPNLLIVIFVIPPIFKIFIGNSNIFLNFLFILFATAL